MRKEVFLLFTLGLVVLLLKKNSEGVAPLFRGPSAQLKKSLVSDAVIVQEVSEQSSTSKNISNEELAVTDFSKEENEEMRGLPKGMKYLPHVKAILTDDYKPNMGKVLLRKGKLTFISSSNLDFEHVVYDSRRDTLQVISTTLKLKNISEAERRKNIGDGWSEFYYSPELRVQYLESSNGQLLDHYESLTQEGYYPQFEIVTATHILK